ALPLSARGDAALVSHGPESGGDRDGRLQLRRHDAHHRARGAVDVDRLADDRAIAGKPPTPDPFADDHHTRAAGLVFDLREVAPNERRDPERGQETRGNVRRLDALGRGTVARVREVDRALLVESDVVEGATL